jgi:hypothetical protein
MADIKKNIRNDVESLQEAATTNKEISKKLDELIHLLSDSELDTASVKLYKERFNEAIDKSGSSKEQIEAFKVIDEKKEASREELLDDFTLLLSSNHIDTETAKTYIKGERLSKIVVGAIGVVLIAMGFGMIIMPAPPYFEMFTVFYFNADDGVTIMDLISLLIILAGIYLLIKSFFRNPARRKRG